FFFSSRRRHTRLQGDWSSDVCSSDLTRPGGDLRRSQHLRRLGTRLWRRPASIQKFIEPKETSDHCHDERGQSKNSPSLVAFDLSAQRMGDGGNGGLKLIRTRLRLSRHQRLRLN